MRIVLVAAASLFLLAGCGSRGGNEQNQAGLPVPPPRPDASATSELASDESFRRNYRALNIQTCINATRADAAQRNDVPADADFRPACTCYIDRAMAGLSVEQLMRLRPGAREQAMIEQCVREHGLDGGSGAASASDGRGE